MDNLYWIAAISLAVLGPVTAVVEIDILPAGEIKQEDDVTITCSKTPFGPFDVLQIQRKIGSTSHTILENNDLKVAYQNTKRYIYLEADSNPSSGIFVLKIAGIMGADRGEYECLDRATREAAVDTINVFVPPQSIEIEYQNDNSGYVNANTDEKVIFTTGMPYGLKCIVNVEGSRENPAVSVKIDETDVASRFETSEVKVDDVDEHGLYKLAQTITLQDMDKEPKATDDGKKFTCSAKMPNHDKELSASIDIEVHYPPAINCESSLKAQVGDEIKLKCTATMSPKYTVAKWTWGDGPEDQLASPGEESANGNLHFMESAEEDRYTFMLHIKEAEAMDFRTYKLVLNNGVAGDHEGTVTFEKEETTTITSTSKKTTSTHGTEVVTDPIGAAPTTTVNAFNMIMILVTAFIIKLLQN